jgi:alkylation response protein AidB-like acyl-CoA dehydrogenase
MTMFRSIDELTRPLEYVSPMDELLGGMVRRWAEEHVIPHRRGFDEDWREHRRIEPALERLLGQLGLQRVMFPEEYGGWGLGHSGHFAVGCARLVEEIARADSGVAVAVGVTFWPMILICREPHVNHRLCRELAPMFCGTTRARLAANAMTEPQGGADIENLDLLRGSTLNTTAVRDGDEWVINGHKLWPTNTGGASALFAVVCTTRPGSTDPDDFAVIFVPADAPGVTQGAPYQKAGMAADKNSDLWFEDVRVPLWYRALGPGDDFTYFKEVISIGNMGSIAMVSGVLMNVYEVLQRFASEVKVGGRPLKENDAAAGVLADLVADLEVIRITCYQYARMIDRPDLYGPPWSDEIVARGRALKYSACDRALKSLGRAVNLMETHGVDRVWDVEKHWRDLKIIQLWMGGKQLCQMETARWYYQCETL